MRKKSSTPNRSFRVADQIQRDLTELIARELQDPRVGMVTVQAVEVTPDYAHAKIYFSVLVGDPKVCEIALNQAAGFLRNGLFKRLMTHTVPTLHFLPVPSATRLRMTDGSSPALFTISRSGASIARSAMAMP